MTRFSWLWLAMLLALCSALYWPALHGPFLFDDFPNLAALTSVDHVDSWRDLGIYLSQPRSFPGRPLAMLSFLLQKAAWPDHPFPFKIVNLGLHLLCGLLVYRLTSMLARRYLADVNASTESDRSASLAALLATAAWLLNPMQVSGVLLVVQRMTLLMALFVMLGLLAYLKGLLEESAGSWRRGTWMTVGLGVCTVLAFLSKENGILLPLFALTLDATVLRAQVTRLPEALRWWRRLLIWPVVLFVTAYLLVALQQLGTVQSTRDFTLGERLMTEPRILFDYIGNSLLPRFGLYGLYHDGFEVSRSVLTPWTTLPSILGLLGAAAWGFIARRRYPLLALAILWYLAGQLIESSTVMLELYFEHRNYVPLIGPFIAIAIGLVGTPQPLLRRRMLGVAALWLALASITTVLSTRLYRSEDTLAVAWARKQPDSVRAQTLLTNRLYAHGHPALALDRVEAALVTNPGNASLWDNRTYLKCMLHTLTPSDMQGLTTMLRGAAFDRSGLSNMETLRKVADAKNCPALNAHSWPLLVDALLDNPSYSDGASAGFLHYQLHEAAVSRGDLNGAIHQLDITYADDPDAEIPRLQAKYLASAGLYDQAITILQNTNYAHLPLLRRLLVNDRAINQQEIDLLKKKLAAGPRPSKSKP
jgi:tetratricopeptide (TPR) repeat protein